jgi:hypothetical protein
MANLRQLTFAIAGLSMLLPLSVTAAVAAGTNDRSLIAMGLCSQMERLVNALMDYASTERVPNISDPKSTSFIFIVDKPIFSVEASKKAWMLVVIAAVGKTLNDNSSYSADQILLAELSMAKEKKYYATRASLGKSLQHKASIGQINLDTMWSEVIAALKPFVVPPK